MTLHKAIEAAREALKIGLNFTNQFRGTLTHFQDINHVDPFIENIKQALAALPDKLMMEEEIIEIACTAAADSHGGYMNAAKKKGVLAAIRALKDANVLYVEEKS